MSCLGSSERLYQLNVTGEVLRLKAGVFVEGLSRMEIDALFRYYFQHPWSRLIVAYLVTFFNFLIFAEDPVSHSQTEARMIVVGNCFSFLFNKYPGLGWNILKVVCWILAIVTGLLAGKFIFHRQLFGKSRAQSFSSDDEEEASTPTCWGTGAKQRQSELILQDERET